jgi:hypothetical protein
VGLERVLHRRREYGTLSEKWVMKNGWR